MLHTCAQVWAFAESKADVAPYVRGVMLSSLWCSAAPREPWAAAAAAASLMAVIKGRH